MLDELKIIPNMTYNVFSGTLNPTQSINQSIMNSKLFSVSLVFNVPYLIFYRHVSIDLYTLKKHTSHICCRV